MKEIIVRQLDTGYLIKLYETEQSGEVSSHAMTSADGMVAKIRELFDISSRHAVQKKSEDIVTSEKHKYGILSELPGKWPIKKEECLVPDPVPLPNNEKVTFCETADGRINIKYRSANVYTSWNEIYQLMGQWKLPNDEIAHLLPDIPSNSKTAIRQFMIAVRDWDVKPGSSVDMDPDKDFRPMLNRSSAHEYERGTLEDVIT